jgi:hypothetical protein
VNPADVTAFVGVAVALASSVGFPVWLHRRQHRTEDATSTSAMITNFTSTLQRERDSLRLRLDESEDRYRGQLKAIEADWEARVTSLKGRVTELEAEVVVLRRALRGDRS